MAETLRSAFQGIWAHKLRSFLTMLGVIIGIAAIIGIVSTIQGTNEQIMQNLIGAGNNNITVSLKQGSDAYMMEMGIPATVSPVSEQQKKDILSVDGVVNASFFTTRTWEDSITRGDLSLSSASVRGIDLRYLDTTGYEVISGRPFIEEDYRTFEKVVLLDEGSVRTLFPEGGAVGVGHLDNKASQVDHASVLILMVLAAVVFEADKIVFGFKGGRSGLGKIPVSVSPVAVLIIILFSRQCYYRHRLRSF